MSATPRETNLCRARNTTIEMVLDRGYTTDQKVLTVDEFTSKYPSAASTPQSISYIAYRSAVPVHIRFLEEDRVGKSSIEALLSEYDRDNVTHIILVVSTKMTYASTALMTSHAKITIEVFQEHELLFNISKHVLVPPHRILGCDERQEVLTRIKARPEVLPRILRSDPMCRYLGAHVGDIVEISRRSRTAGTSIYYKIVEEKVNKT